MWTRGKDEDLVFTEDVVVQLWEALCFSSTDMANEYFLNRRLKTKKIHHGTVIKHIITYNCKITFPTVL